MRFLSPDSKFGQVLEAAVDLILLNLCWIFTSLPVISIGASTTALYTILGRKLRGEGSGTVIPFCKAFASNFKTGTLYWLMELVTIVLCAFNVWYTTNVLDSPSIIFHIAKWASIVILIAVVTLFSLLYPQIARYECPFWQYLKNAVYLTATNLVRTIGNLILILIPVLFYVFLPELFIQIGFLWTFIGFAFIFYLSARVVRKIFTPMEELPGNITGTPLS